MDEGYGDLLTGHCTGQLGLAGAVLGIGTVYRPGCGHITRLQRNRWRRTMNRLASAQVTSKRCVFFFRPRGQCSQIAAQSPSANSKTIY
jgi:hypothetical protein